jgi:hypothetical protein
MDVLSALKIVVIFLILGVFYYQIARIVGSKVFHFSRLRNLIRNFKNTH